jgi:hypothetical protein
MSEPVVEPTVEPTAPATAPVAAEPSAPQEVPKFGDLLQYAPDDYKDAKTWEKFKDTDMATALKSIVDMDRYVGKKGDIPQEGASPEEIAAFAKKLGFENSDEPQTYVELDPVKFGDSKSELEGMYNEGINGIMQEAIKNFAENPSPAAFAKALQDWANGDAEGTITNQIEAKAEMEQQMKDVAQKLGTTPEVMRQMNEEVVNRYGWTEATTIHEVLNTLARETTNSNTLKESLSSTPVGKQSRMSEILNEPTFWDGTNKKLIDEHKRLFDELNAQ